MNHIIPMTTFPILLQDLNISSETKKFWDDVLLEKFNKSYSSYSSFSRSDKLPNWDKLISSNFRVFDLFQKLSEYYKKERYDFNNKDKFFAKEETSTFSSIEFLELLKKDKISIDNIFLNTLVAEPENKSGWTYAEFIELHLHYLKENKQKLHTEIEKQYFLELNEHQQYYSYVSVDENINLFFSLMDVIQPNKINHTWFKEKLEFFCTIKDDDSRQLVNQAEYLNFDSQKKIYDYIVDLFPDNINEHNKYFSKILPSPVFKTSRLHQGSIEINLYQILNELHLNQKDLNHLIHISKECLNVVSQPSFLELIEKDIPVSNIYSKDNNSSVILNFSTNSYEDLEDFEKILLRSLNGVLKVSDKIRISWSESYSGADELITNMDSKFIHQHYLFQTLNETLSTNSNSAKKMKI